MGHTQSTIGNYTANEIDPNGHAKEEGVPKVIHSIRRDEIDYTGHGELFVAVGHVK